MDLNFGANSSVTPYNFTSGMGTGGVYGYNSLNSFGQASPTLGSGVPDLGGTVANSSAPVGLGAAGAGSAGLGMNLPTLQLGVQGLSSLASLYTGLKALGLAKDQFAFQKDLASKNYANSVSSYNTQLSDRANARAVTENQSPASAQAYINANKLT